MTPPKIAGAATTSAYSAVPATQDAASSYVMRISRMTVDKLGVRLYDTVSAVVAELIANAYDADATRVTVCLPLATQLAKKVVTTVEQGKKTEWIDIGYFIEVIDTGHGMTPDEAQQHFLEVGRERRHHAAQGAVSRKYKRPVMGRKGIGKLAPFGICRRIEVISAGGEKTEKGYLVSHFVMDYARIVSDSDKPVPLDTGSRDGSYSPEPGTTIRLSSFLGKKVPDRDVFLRQLARRFAPSPGFEIVVQDTRAKGAQPSAVGPLDVPVQEQTQIDLTQRPVTTEDGEVLPVTGWLALAKDAYKDEETTGVRIYARGKIVGWTRDFEQPAGYTGEFTMRSYLVGEVTAEWLDKDDGDDLVRTDRQGIIWDSEYGNALRSWGTGLIKEIGAASRAPRRKRVSEIFLETSRIEQRAKEQFSDTEIVSTALDLAKKIGGFAAEDELTDPAYVDELSSVILTIAPHSALMAAFRVFESDVTRGSVTVGSLRNLFGKTRVAEMASYGQIAYERVRVIRKLEKIVVADTDEAQFQGLIAEAPWLIEPTWSIISENESLRNFKHHFEQWYTKERGLDVVLAIGHETKRPDFTLIEIGQMLHIVEIKASGHTFDDTDCERLVNYIDAFDDFFRDFDSVRQEFPHGYRIQLVADSMHLTKPNNKQAFAAALERMKVVRSSWFDFLNRAKKSHEEFLRVANVRDPGVARAAADDSTDE